MLHLIGYYPLHFLLAVSVTSVICVYPLWRIFKRAGLSPWWALLALIPFLGLWLAGVVLAMKAWPNAPEGEAV